MECSDTAKECGKNFSETTGTPLAWLKKKGKWAKYLHCMLSGYYIRKCASEVGICIQTPLLTGNTKRFLNKHHSIEQVFFVCFDDHIYKTYQSLL